MLPDAAPGIAQAIQFAVAPALLLVGIGGLLNVLAARLGRVVDRARWLEADIPDAQGAQREMELDEITVLDRRMTLAHWSIDFCTVAALVICFVVIVLFVSTLIEIDVTIPVALLFITAMLSLTCGLIAFLAEVTIATNTVKVRDEFVRRSSRRGRRWRSGD